MKKVLVLSLFILTFFSSTAQDSTSIKPKDQVILEKVRTAFNSPYIQFGGYGMLIGEYNDSKEVKTSGKPRFIMLWMKGSLTKTINYYVLSDVANPTLYEMYAEWKPSKSFNVRGGQMKTPLSIENQMSYTVLETIACSRSTSSLTGMGGDVQNLYNGTNSTGRDIGVRIAGATENDLLEYVVGVFQGAGINTLENDNTKDLVASLTVQPIKNFRISTSGYFGKAKYEKSGESVMDSHRRNRWTFGFEYKSDRCYARSEYINANDGGVRKEGLYGTGLYYVVPKKINLMAKADYYNQNKSAKESVMDYTLGVNYYFYNLCRFQLNYTYSDYSKDWGKGNSNVVLGQLQIVF